jgi:hypothetical protein
LSTREEKFGLVFGTALVILTSWLTVAIYLFCVFFTHPNSGTYLSFKDVYGNFVNGWAITTILLALLIYHVPREGNPLKALIFLTAPPLMLGTAFLLWFFVLNDRFKMYYLFLSTCFIVIAIWVAFAQLKKT